MLLIAPVLPLSEGLQIDLILCGMAVGTPFPPKLMHVAKGDLAFTMGLMVLLTVVSVALMSIVLPLVISKSTYVYRNTDYYFFPNHC